MPKESLISGALHNCFSGQHEGLTSSIYSLWKLLQCGYTNRTVQREYLLQAEVNSSVVSYNQGAKHENEGRHLQDDLDSSSVDSTHVRPLRINRIKHLSSGSTLKTWKTQCQPRSAESVSRTVGTRRFQSHRNVSTKGAYHEVSKPS